MLVCALSLGMAVALTYHPVQDETDNIDITQPEAFLRGIRDDFNGIWWWPLSQLPPHRVKRTRIVILLSKGRDIICTGLVYWPSTLLEEAGIHDYYEKH